jgi:hypothetical protein
LEFMDEFKEKLENGTKKLKKKGKRLREDI